MKKRLYFIINSYVSDNGNIESNCSIDCCFRTYEKAKYYITKKMAEFAEEMTNKSHIHISDSNMELYDDSIIYRLSYKFKDTNNLFNSNETRIKVCKEIIEVPLFENCYPGGISNETFNNLKQVYIYSIEEKGFEIDLDSDMPETNQMDIEFASISLGTALENYDKKIERLNEDNNTIIIKKPIQNPNPDAIEKSNSIHISTEYLYIVYNLKKVFVKDNI